LSFITLLQNFFLFFILFAIVLQGGWELGKYRICHEELRLIQLNMPEADVNLSRRIWASSWANAAPVVDVQSALPPGSCEPSLFMYDLRAVDYRCESDSKKTGKI
jgi:hypothetical protein